MVKSLASLKTFPFLFVFCMQNNILCFILLVKTGSWYCHAQREMRFGGEK